MSLELSEVFSRKYPERKLANFYIFENANEKSLKVFWEAFFKKNNIQFSFEQNNHPDIFLMISNNDNGVYKNGDRIFSDLGRFLSHDPISLHHKFVFLLSPEKLGTNISNKLLKTLEEPGDNTSIIFFKTGKTEFIPTIASRAIHIKLRSDQAISPIKTLEELSRNIKILVEQSGIKSSKKFLESFDHFIQNHTEKHAIITFFQSEKEIASAICELIYSFLSFQGSAPHQSLNLVKHMSRNKSFNNSLAGNYNDLLDLLLMPRP